LRKDFVVIVLSLSILLAGSLVFFWENSPAFPSDESQSSKYLACQENDTRIYLVSAIAYYDTAKVMFSTADGLLVHEGHLLFVVNFTLRNDYSSVDPPPPSGDISVSPPDGTAYVSLKLKLWRNTQRIDAADVSLSDFSNAFSGGAGVILSSGETVSRSLCYAIDDRNIDRFMVEAVFVGDCIPL
jgi:hypothetical protein